MRRDRRGVVAEALSSDIFHAFSQRFATLIGGLTFLDHTDVVAHGLLLRPEDDASPLAGAEWNKSN